MSTNYYFYIGEKIDGVFRPGRICLENGKLASILKISKAFSGDIKYDFSIENDKELIDERLTFAKDYKLCNNEKQTYSLYYISLNDLVTLRGDEGIRHGYVDVEAVNNYEVYGKKSDTDFICYDFNIISPIVYANMDKEEQKKYVYYSWVDYESKEYLASRLLNIATSLYIANVFNTDNLYIYLEIC